MKKILIIALTIISLCLLVFLLNSTTPVTAGPFGILAIFIFAYILLVVVIAYAVHWVSWLIFKLSGTFISRKPVSVIALKRSYYYASVIAAAPIMLVGLQSVGSVGFYELLLVSVFVIVGSLFISKRVN